MADVIKGTGVKWSVGAIVFTAGITATYLTQSATTQRTSENANIKDNGGTIKTKVFHGFMKTLSLNVVPSGASVAAARTSGNALMPSPGTLVSVTDDSGTIITDNYNVLSAREGRTVDGVATIDLELEAGDEGVELATAPIT